MDYKTMWETVKRDVESAVNYGYQRGFNNDYGTEDCAKLFVYRYVLELMESLESKEEK